MTASARIRVVEIAVVAMFILGITLPLAGKLLPAEGAFALTENRRPAPFPTIQLASTGWRWSIASFPRRFERYWNDSFAFRWYLIRAHSLANLAFGVSSSPKALIGRDGFLFYAAEHSVEYFRRTKPFSDADLARWRNDLERRRSWLQEFGIRYLVVVAPNKETIYPEFMPPALRPVRADSRLDQLIADLRDKSSIDILDLRPALKRARNDGRIYHKTDTHWNDAGARVASREILMRIKAWFPLLDTTERPGSFRVRLAGGGDLARILALEDRYPEEYVEWRAADIRASTTHASSYPGRDVEIMQCVGCEGPVVVMNQDSFNANLAPFLAEHFQRLVLVDGTRLDTELIERERPALVIQEFVERALMCPDLRGC